MTGYGAFSNAFDAVDDIYNYYSAGDPVLGMAFGLNQSFVLPWFNVPNLLGPGIVHAALGSRGMSDLVADRRYGQVNDRNMLDRSVSGYPATTHSDHLVPAKWTTPLQRQLFSSLADDMNDAARVSRKGTPP